MSTNSKNTIRPEFLKNFTKKVKTRYILLEKGKPIKSINIGKAIPKINSLCNQIIQTLNLKINDRHIPYINLQVCYSKIRNKRVRIFLHNDATSFLFEQEIKQQIENGEKEISHILDILIAESYNKITISNLSCDAEIVIDPSCLVIAVVDILLDIVMFNSYSFLKGMNVSDKKIFSNQKFEFYNLQHLESFYRCSNEKLLYYSLAFSARKSNGNFNIDKYIELWNDFVHTYYSNYVHTEKTIKEQLLQHVDKEELPQNLQYKFNDKPKGAYLVLRTNRDRTEDIHPLLCSLFGIRKYRKGRIKIVPIADFEDYVPLLEHLDVSAFKIVKS